MTKETKHHHQISSLYPLTKGKVGVRIIKTRLTDIYFGVILERRRKEKYTCQQKESIARKLTAGKVLYEDGQQSGISMPAIPIGKALYLSVDKDVINWFSEGEKLITRPLPVSMQGVPLYMFVSLHNEGDEIEMVQSQ
jgi:hypothetical protein